ncbi:putative sugar transporter [Hypoxylon sp. FL1284]|nr:putative sugar transporter [Hypoxylon sp. FL1284]
MGLSDKLSDLPLMVCVTIVNAASMSWFGYDQGVFSGVLISSDFKYWFPQTNDSNISGITSSCFSLGAFFGAIFAFFYGDKMGRKKTIWIALATNVIGSILQITSWHFPQLIIGRIINGFGMGVSSSTCPVYQAECTKPRFRGKLVVFQSLSLTAAYCLSNWMNYALYFQGGVLQWRFPLGFQLIFPCMIVIPLLLVPDSPRWLMLKDRNEEAIAVIARLAGRGVSKEDPDVVAEFLSVQATIEQERRETVSTADMLRCRDKAQNLRRILLSSGTQFMQQFSGVNALGYYLPTVLVQVLGYDQQKSRLLTGVNATIYLFAAICCLFLIDRLGRRKMMLYGSSTMGSCYFIIAMTLLGANIHPSMRVRLGEVTTAFFFLYYFFYGTSFAKVPWVFNSEVNSIGWRTRGAAVATATNWMGGFIVTQFTKTGVDNLGWGFFLLFAGFCYAYFPIVYCFYPETSLRTLEDMDQIFIQYPSIFVCGKRDLTQRARPQLFIDAEHARVAEAQSAKTGVVAVEVKDHTIAEQGEKV